VSTRPDIRPADVVLLNGRVRTVDRHDRVVSAVAVRERWIAAVGDDAAVRPLIDRHTDVIDLQGREVVPGFVDAHHHFGATCQPHIDCKDPSILGIDDLQRAVAARAAELPPGRWIRGKGYNHDRLRERRHPTRWDLDRVSPDHPVLLMRTCGHIGAANSCALALLGLDSRTPDPAGGRLERVDGELSGVLFETALYPVARASGAGMDELLAEIPARAQACLAMGWTTLQDPGVRNPALIPALITAERSGLLPLRVQPFVELSGMEPHGLALFRAGVLTGFGNDRVKIGPCKLMVDGSSSGPTAATREPYCSQPDFQGVLQMQATEVNAFVVEGRQAGFQMTMHAVGDRAIEMCLDAFELADGRWPAADPRHRIEHCAMCPPDLVERVRRLGVTPVVQPSFVWEFGDGYLRDYGPERGGRLFPLRDFLDAGIVVAGSTDAPAGRLEPLVAIQHGVLRTTRAGQVCASDQRVTVPEALRMFTFGAAYAAREEQRLGSLEPGKLADLVVLDHGLEDVPASEIGEIGVDVTMVGGQVAFSRKEARHATV
jgi:predicted amidohydrolase YtcJ